MLYRIIGLGLIQSWLWLFFLNGPLLFSVSEQWNFRSETLFIVFLIANSFSFLLNALIARRLDNFRNNQFIYVGAALLMTAGTLLTGLGPSNIFSGDFIVIFSVALSGLGAGFLVTAWGKYYSYIPIKDASLAFGGSVSLGTAVFLCLNALSSKVSVGVISMAPLFSVLLLFKPFTKPNESNHKIMLTKQKIPLPAKLVFMIMFVDIAGGVMYKIISLGGYFSAQISFWQSNIVYWSAVFLASITIYLKPDLDLRWIYRPVLPLLGTGFLLFPFLYRGYAIVPFSLLQTAFAFFDVYTWLCFAYLAAQNNFSSRLIGWGMFFLTCSILTGEFVFTGLISVVSFNQEWIIIISIAATIFMVVGTAILPNQKETFSGFHLINQPDESAQPQIEINCEQVLPLDNAKTPNPEFTEKLAKNKNTGDTPVDSLSSQYNLTNREKEIVTLLVHGRNNPYIREILNISNNTLKTHLRNIFRKFEVSNRQDVLNLYQNHN